MSSTNPHSITGIPAKTHASICEEQAKHLTSPVAAPGPTAGAKPSLKTKKALPEVQIAKEHGTAGNKLGAAGETWKQFTAAQKTKDSEVVSKEAAKLSGKRVFRLKK
ncbi:hypothetical protein CLAFUW4_04182 [Fulvia fulva]|uniref:Uncharacterized protein n=1 Tax=Passalora fulva TaxID=5499 RepID=A0A9Q8P866_PASFU|nr:uncharacterized protein CLAFUR5_04145 [Fulvia fulva]KAK4626545.1 hypothetical protein CLAFUR4_04168 [Fulvia fulva]KAK4627721.1 hypothetical protein CLAFUR0_04169 [Fulvia fulva]UJO16875.1 hypothetical protein CLAFUR5_04145 [Fulvia fulva]WPV13353.1 hypothetical protein CLAFUW4_04182 [Fulvia fulva]WPV29177.1 hypothetical protein CLAFUW7_04171 [Fulvia fulva]